MSISEDYMPARRPLWVGLLGLTLVLGVIGFIFIQMNQKVRTSRLNDATVAELHQEVARNPNDAELLFRLAFRHHRFGENKEALPLMQRLVQLQPNSDKAWF